MDWAGLDEPNEAPARSLRFGPKSKSGPKPKPKPKPKPEPPPQNAAPPPPPVAVKKEEESHSQSQTQPQPQPQTQPQSSVVMDVDGDVALEPKAEERDGLQLSNGDAMELDKVAVEEAEEEDYVVAEYDVYFSPSDGDTKLYVLQYPMRPSWRPYELDQRCKEVRVKPNGAELEVDLSIDMDSDNYNLDAPNADKMKHETLSSHFVPPQATGYAVGVLMGKKLYLNPIHAVMQLRPSMEYLDSGSKKRIIPGSASKVEGSPSVANVGSSKKQSKQMETQVVESWIPLQYHNSSSDVSAKYLRKMVTEEDTPLQFPMKPGDYLNSLCPPTVINKTKPKGPSRRLLLSLPLEERVKTLLIEGPPIQRFNAIKHLAPDEPVEDVLQVLQKYANLIQGLWVAKTNIRYPNATGPEALVRDYVLLLFSESPEPVIKDSQLDVLGSRKSLAKTMLREIAMERTFCKDWKFKESKDVSFINHYRDVVLQQEKLWQDHGKQMREKFPQFRAGPRISVKPEKTSNKPGSSNEDTIKATKHSSRPSMSKETREALPKVLRKLFQNHKVCSFRFICQALRDMAVSMSTQPKADARAAVSAASGVDAPPEELHAAITEVAEYINNVYVLKTSPDHPELNPFRSLVVELYRGTPNAKLKKSEIIEAAKIKLQKEPTNSEFQKVISEFCVSEGGRWILKSGDWSPK